MHHSKTYIYNRIEQHLLYASNTKFCLCPSLDTESTSMLAFSSHNAADLVGGVSAGVLL
jgi:hypothetical protein